MTYFLQKSEEKPREQLKLIQVCLKYDWKFRFGEAKDCPKDWVPVGDVPFCEEVLGYSPSPDYYPRFLESWMHRRHAKFNTESQMHLGDQYFIKGCQSYKSHTPWISHILPSGNWIVSDVVTFVSEWRCYVARGKVVDEGWYEGEDELLDPPNLDIEWPPGFCGAVDFGKLDDGRVALVECHHPYACGWYGENHEAFVDWLWHGWWSLKNG